MQLAEPQCYLGSQAATPCLPLQPLLPHMKRIIQVAPLQTNWAEAKLACCTACWQISALLHALHSTHIIPVSALVTRHRQLSVQLAHL